MQFPKPPKPPHLIIVAHPSLPRFRFFRTVTAETFEVQGVETMGKALRREVTRFIKRNPGSEFRVYDSEGRTLTYNAKRIFNY